MIHAILVVVIVPYIAPGEIVASCCCLLGVLDCSSCLLLLVLGASSRRPGQGEEVQWLRGCTRASMVPGMVLL